MTEQPDVLKSYLTFKLGDEMFAAYVGKVLEILEVPRITKVPRSPDFMRGVVNLRGSVLPVIDARAKFGLPRAADTINSCIIVLNIEMEDQHITTGAVVDAVQEVIEIEEGQVQAAPGFGSRYKSEFIEGMIKRDEQFIMILSLDKVFSSQEASILQEIMNKTPKTQELKPPAKSRANTAIEKQII
jgi:purine-binding chemotaxis protein CheW